MRLANFFPSIKVIFLCPEGFVNLLVVINTPFWYPKLIKEPANAFTYSEDTLFPSVKNLH